MSDQIPAEGPRVTLNPQTQPETPSGRLIAAAQKTGTVTDALGRRIAVRNLGALDRLRLFELIGPENSRNDRYIGIAAVALCAKAIDDEPFEPPLTKRMLESRVQQLGDDGIEAVAKFFEAQKQGTEGESPDPLA